jgi:hypothetical protein
VYELSAYVRAQSADGSLLDSDAVRSATPVTLASFDASIRRRWLPGGPLMIEAISAPTDWSAGKAVTVSVRLRNTTSSAVQAQAWFILGPSGSSTPWVGAAYIFKPALQSPVPAYGTVTLSMPWTVSAQAGTYEVSAWLRWNNPASGAFVDDDGAWLSGSVRVS